MLLDTQTLLWYLTEDAQLPSSVYARINRTARVYVSAASIWEIAIMGKAGKLLYQGKPLSSPSLVSEIIRACAAQNLLFLPISQHDAALAPYLASDHKDPFDRVLAAQASQHELAMVSCDPVFEGLSSKIHRIWDPMPQPRKRTSRS